MSDLPDPLQVREREHDVHDLFVKRWSPRAFSGERLSEQELMSLFEAARWAPSSYNEQEWRFLWAEQGTEHWSIFFDLLMEGNQSWCAKASHLIAVIARTTFIRNGKENTMALLDTGAALQNFLLQATQSGIAAHPMGGFNRKDGVAVLNIPEEFTLAAMVAVGKPGDPSDLPEELAQNEVPSQRKPLSSIVQEGVFSFSE